MTPTVRANAWVKNTFLEFSHEQTCSDDEEDDPEAWIVGAKAFGRQCTDSVLDRTSRFCLQEEGSMCPSKMRKHSIAGSEPEREAEPVAHAAQRDVVVQAPDANTACSPVHNDGEPHPQVTSAVSGKRVPAKHLEMMGAENAAVESGLDGRTTVMLRNIPSKYTPQRVMKEINFAGFLGRYDFFYLPMDQRNRANRGFAFINFNSPAAAEDFFRTFNNQNLMRFSSDKSLAVMPADLQGFEQNALRFATSLRLRRKRNTENGPLFFRPIPEFEHEEQENAGACLQEHQAPELAWPPQDGHWPQVQPDGHPFALAYKQLSLPFPVAQPGRNGVPPQVHRRQFCTSCGQRQQPQYRFCAFCGSALEL